MGARRALRRVTLVPGILNIIKVSRKEITGYLGLLMTSTRCDECEHSTSESDSGQEEYQAIDQEPFSCVESEIESVFRHRSVVE
jgi:hypothetical protein